MQMHRYIRPTV